MLVNSTVALHNRVLISIPRHGITSRTHILALDWGAGSGQGAPIGDAEKRFLYQQERERSITERLDDNVLG